MRAGGFPPWVVFTYVALICVCTGVIGSSDTAEIEDCGALVDKFAEERGNVSTSPHVDSASMLFFLHIPRTAGRTYHACFLKLGRPPSRRCEKSYDTLRLNASVPNCGLLGSHDDFSVVTDSLPADTAVVTQLRDPVDRLLSAYEFALEVAVRGLRPNRRPPDPKKTGTREVWPWSLLVPWLEDDLRARSAANPGRSAATEAGGDPYDSPAVAMPLREFLEAPFVRDTLHNGSALQVLGLTNYSRWADGAALRGCAAADARAAERLAALALARLRSLAHVGLTERLPESVASLAASLGLRMGGPAWKVAADAFTAAENGSTVQARGDDEYLLPLPLWRTYGQCVARARKRATFRRETSMRALWTSGKLRFSREARARIAPEVLQRIRELNAMDEALHAAGKELLQARLAQQRAEGRLEAVPDLPQADLDAIAREPNRPGAPRRGRLREDHVRHRGSDELRRQ